MKPTISPRPIRSSPHVTARLTNATRESLDPIATNRSAGGDPFSGVAYSR
jgi:hypothetical protein